MRMLLTAVAERAALRRSLARVVLRSVMPLRTSVCDVRTFSSIELYHHEQSQVVPHAGS